jgi:hypothetical protein
VRIRFKGVVDVDLQDSTPDWASNNQPVAPEGAPTVLYVILGRRPLLGAGALPDAEHRANRRPELMYTNFQTTALCSPT